jgi:hypothetical protein
MDSTRAPVPSDSERLSGPRKDASRRRLRVTAMYAVACFAVFTMLAAVAPSQLSTAGFRETHGKGPVGRPDSAAARQEPGSSLPSVKLGIAAPSSRTGRPAPAHSQYVKTTSRSRLLRLGCAEGRRLRRSTDPRGVIVILDFGRPTRKGRGRGAAWGASLFQKGFHSTSVIRRAAQAYGEGAWRCMGGTKATTQLTIGIGTSNFGPGVTSRHGRAWAEMVNEANEWAEETGLFSAVRFAGANDIELSWAGPKTTKAWVRGYDSVARWPYYDYGDAAACPPRGNCQGAWTQEDVWYVAWGARTAIPLPQVYTPNGVMAEQWYRLSLYSYRVHGSPMVIAGVLSQRTACRQSTDSCRGMNNSPSRAWHQLHRALNRDRRTAQPLHWSTDIAWTRER